MMLIRTTRRRLFTFASMVLLVPVVALAHHSYTAEFDTTKPIKLSGVLTRVEWANPHIWLYLDVKDDPVFYGAKAFKTLQSRFEYNETGGAPLLGVDGICMICHGSSDARAIRNALKTTRTIHDRKVNEKITEIVGSWG